MDANGSVESVGHVNAKIMGEFVTNDDFKKALSLKTNQHDHAMLYRKIEIIHKQIKQIMVLITNKFKQSCEPPSNETKHAKQKKKDELLNNAILVQQWIANFDSKNINDCFDNK